MQKFILIATFQEIRISFRVARISAQEIHVRRRRAPPGDVRNLLSPLLQPLLHRRPRAQAARQRDDRGEVGGRGVTN